MLKLWIGQLVPRAHKGMSLQGPNSVTDRVPEAAGNIRQLQFNEVLPELAYNIIAGSMTV
jgi:hypothetical protein